MDNPPSSFLSFFSFLFALLIGSTFLGALLPGGMHVSKPENGGEQPFFRLWFHLMGCRTTTRWLHLITDLLLLNRADLMVRMIPFPASYSLPSIGTISFHLNDPILRQIITQSDTNLEIEGISHKSYRKTDSFPHTVCTSKF